MNYTPEGIQQACNEYTDQQYYLSQEREAAYAEGRKDEAEADKWQPIETVPQSEARFLVISRSGRITIDTGHFMHNMMHAAKVDGDECFYTHWMPLPKPPAPGSGALGDGGSGT